MIKMEVKSQEKHKMNKGSNIPILVVDTSPAVRKIIHNFLEQLGFTNIESASTSSQALEKTLSNTYKLILCDSYLESMSGVEFLKSLKSQEKYKKIPFLMMSSDPTPEAFVEAINANADNYIVKPFNAATLRAKLVALLGQF
jgi:two-component system chemotaxis response regulator CheY